MSNPATTGGVEDGTFYKKQLLSSNRLVAFSHRARFDTARRLVAPFAGGRLLDYGCGDGTFLWRVADLFPDAVGLDVSEQRIENCRQRLGNIARLRFLHTSAFSGHELSEPFDVATCMETLEHCPPPQLEQVLSDLKRVVKPNGTIIISVPIEIGPTLLAKQMVRHFLGRRGVGDYQYTESYTRSELVKMMFATSDTEIERPVYGSEHPHKGFNWRSLKRRLEREFRVEDLTFSPFGSLRGWISSQVWFILRSSA